MRAMPTFSGALLVMLAALSARLADCLQTLADKSFAEAVAKGAVRLADGSLEITAMLAIPGNIKEPQNKILGWQLSHADGDNVVATISKVRAEGSVATWNKANPRQKLMPGDKIIKVNNVPWHNNTKMFVESIGKQIHAVSKRLGDTRNRLYVKIQRPATKVPEKKLADGSLEFTAVLKIPKGSKATHSKLVGWQLSDDDDDVPASISKIRKSGALANWNKEHPAQKVMPGDKIMKVNNIPWHNNTKLFVEHVGRRIERAIKRQEGAEHHLYVKFQRAPKDPQDQADDQQFSSL